MNRRDAVLAPLTLGCLASNTWAQPEGKLRRIGFLAASAPPQNIVDAFQEGLRERGYVEGKDVVVEYRWPNDSNQRLSDLAAELVRLKVDVIVVWTTPPTLAAKQVTSTIPIVFFSVADPVGTGVVSSFARPTGNVTGVTNLSNELSGKVFRLLVETMPRISRVAVMRNPSNPGSALQLSDTETAARRSGLQPQLFDARVVADLESAFIGMSKARVEGVVFIADSLWVSQRQAIAELAQRHRLLTVFQRRENVEAGGLLSYGPSLSSQMRQALTYVDRILKGARPGDLPVEQPLTFELVINLKTAKALGLTIPQSLLLRADEVIQ